MKLFYRANSYDYEPTKTPVRQSGPAYNLMYRGVTYRVDPNAEESALPSTYRLMYRGVTYLMNRTTKGASTVASQSFGTQKKEILSVVG